MERSTFLRDLSIDLHSEHDNSIYFWSWSCYLLFMLPTSKKLRGHIDLGLSVVCPSPLMNVYLCFIFYLQFILMCLFFLVYLDTQADKSHKQISTKWSSASARTVW